FSEIQEGSDDSIWISGTYGVAHLQGPARRVTPQTFWGEFLLPRTNRLNNLQRPFEFPAGELTFSANSPASESRAVVQFHDGLWSSFPVRGEKLRQAWQSWDGWIWGYSTVSLFRMRSNEENPVLRKEPVSGAQYDIALETNGVFWVASGEGLVRYAPPLWRSRPDLEDVQSAVDSLLFDGAGGLWLVTPSGLLFVTPRGIRTFPWPEEVENLPPRQSTFLLSDGRILFGAQIGPLFFDPKTETFGKLQTPEALHVHLLGELSDGSIAAWFEHAEKDAPLDLRKFKENHFERIPIPTEKWEHGEVTFAKETSNGDLWIGCSVGLVQLRSTGSTLIWHGNQSGLRNDRILTLTEVSEGRIWCGTASRVYEYRGQKWEPILNTPDRVTAILPLEGDVWVSTAVGIHLFRENSWIPHGGNEGLPPGAINTLRVSPLGKLWAGTSRGAMIFHPDADLEPPRMLVPTLEETQTPSTLEPTVVQFRGQDKWDYCFPKDLMFSYRLDERNWTPFSNVTSRVFQNLSSGTHVVEVLAMDRNGNKAAAPSRLEFAVIVPWFKDPRLLLVTVFALCVTIILAGLAVNRHLQLKRSYAEVEQIVAQRTSELEHATQELIHSQKMRALGTMAAGIAHDFNNILSIIKGSAQIIENNVEDKEKIRTRVDRIQMVVEQGTTIVKALLGLGKTGKTDLTECDIGALLHETRKLLSDRFAATVQIQIDISPELPRVRCSQEVLQQILLNLILNAVDAMHHEGVVHLSATETRTLPGKIVLEPEMEQPAKAAGSYLLISVSDEGSGISPENLPRIFEPFFTTKGFSSRRGTGLGLSMVYELAKSLGYGLALQ
ncbi:MAG TPA: ATP-binding protein, partial [Verrucomicrobiae bacterium]|nr:ATP-binding protein [Verrucomicrobiae bacterium]